MKVIITCVNYNSYPELEKFLESVDLAINRVSKNEASLEVLVADGSSEPRDFTWQSKRFVVRVFKMDNLGYFGGAGHAMELYGLDNIHKADYVAISNVDLTLSEDFFEKLSSARYADDIGEIAPEIYSVPEKRDKNPKIIHRPSAKRLMILRTMYRFPILHKIYEATLYKRKKIRPKYNSMEIYAGHGSFVILTRAFFSKIPKIAYPNFLFGEEQYLAEEIRKAGLKVQYDPSLKIVDDEHKSTSGIRRHPYYDYNRKAMEFILKNYYEQD